MIWMRTVKIMIKKDDLARLGITRVRLLNPHDMLCKPFASSPDLVGAPYVAVLPDRKTIYIKCLEFVEIKNRLDEYLEFVKNI